MSPAYSNLAAEQAARTREPDRDAAFERVRRDWRKPWYLRRPPESKLFPWMAKLVPEGEFGEAEVKHRVVTADEVKREHLRSRMRGGDPYAATVPGTYAMLLVGGELVMSDTDMERITNAEFVRRAEGDVFVGGLGLGMVLHALARGRRLRPIRSVTVVEKSADVIALIRPTLPATLDLRIVHADLLAWTPPKGARWDTAYFDIWANITSDNLSEMGPLHRRFHHRLNKANPRAWMMSWRRDYCRALARGR